MAVYRDRAALLDREQQATYAPEQLGRTQSMTPAGYLLCTGVRIARTGSMLYLPREVPEVTPAPNGQMIVVTRDADVLFSPETLASFSGMDITDDHPPNLLTPETAAKYSVGTVLNPRQGDGVDSEYMVADLLIKAARLIKLVLARKKREVSCGYDAEVEEVKPGLGRQARIIGNHVAIVDRGRAGPTCAIQDEEPTMAKRKPTFMDRIRQAFADNDETALEAALDDAPAVTEEAGEDGGVHVHIHQPAPVEAAAPVVDEETDPYEARFKAIEDTLSGCAARMDEIAASLAPKTEPDATEVKDEDATEEEAAEREEMMDAAAKAEILLPGHKPGTMDGAPKRKDITAVRRDVLTRAFADAARKGPVEAVTAGADLATASPGQIKVFFDAAAAIARAQNNAGRPIVSMPQGPMTAAKLAERLRARRATR